MLDWLEKNVQISNINEVCVVLIVTIFSVGFPIFYQAKEKIKKNYDSQILLKFFDKERNYKNFVFILKLSLFVLIPWVFNFQPIFFDNFFVNNSAKIMIIFFAILLVFTFFKLVKKLTLFNNSNELFNYLKRQYNSDGKKSWLEEVFKKYSKD
jgi:hypothetical protein